MKSAGKARSNGLYRHIRTSKEIIRNLLNDYNERFGMIVNLFVCLFITVSGVVISQTRIWYVLVSAVPMRMMCPLLHVLPNGLAAEAGNPLLDTGVIVPGMCLSIIWFVFVTVLFLKWFERREVK